MLRRTLGVEAVSTAMAMWLWANWHPYSMVVAVVPPMPSLALLLPGQAVQPPLLDGLGVEAEGNCPARGRLAAWAEEGPPPWMCWH